MLHPRLTSVDGTQVAWLATIGPYGSWGDLSYRTRWGEGACGMYEASWTMPLPAGFEHPLLRRGTLVELMAGSYRVGSPLVLAFPTVGAGLEEPWTCTSTGIGRDVEGDHSFYAFRLSDGAATAVPSEAAAFAKAHGWRVDSVGSSVPTGAVGGSSTTDELMTCGSLFNAAAESGSTRWGVNSDNAVFFAADPTTPTYQVTPGAVALGSSDDGYATVVWGRYHDSTVDSYLTVSATDSDVEDAFGRKEYAASLIPLGPMSAAAAQAFTDGILARTKGRLAWTNNLTLTSNQLLTMGGVPADLSMVAEDVGRGNGMVRLHGIWSPLLEFNGQTYLDVVMGEAQLVDGDQQIQLSPMGMAPRDFAKVIEEVTGYKDGV